MALEKHRTFREIVAHTAKCEKCGKHNTSILYRCIDCTFPICTPCWNAEGGTGRHRNAEITEPPVILPPLQPNKTKKPKKEKTATTTARPRRNVVVSDSEPDDYDIPDAAANIQKSKKRSMTLKTDYTAASSNDENPEEYPEDVLKAADLLLGFFHAADEPTSASSAASCSTNSGLAAVLDATGTMERRPNPSPRQRKPSASFASDPAPRLYEINKPNTRHEYPPLVPEEEEDDADMFEYGSASSFTPINARKETVRPRERRILPSIESSKPLAEARNDPSKSPSDRFLHHSRHERPRAPQNDGRDRRVMKMPENRYEEIDSDVEIIGARDLRHFEPFGPSFGSGNWDPSRMRYQDRP